MSSPITFKTIYRVLSVVSLVGFGLMLGLVLRKSPAPNVANDPQAAARVTQKFAAADQAKASGQQPEVQLDRTELNSYLAQNLQTEGSTPTAVASVPVVPTPDASANPSNAGTADPTAALNSEGETLEQVQSSVKDVKVDMDGDLVKCYVIFDYHGKDLSLELDGHLSTQNGFMKFDPVAGKLGSMPLPQSMLQSVVDKMMASPENREKLRLPPDISDIQIQNGQAVVQYK